MATVPAVFSVICRRIPLSICYPYRSCLPVRSLSSSTTGHCYDLVVSGGGMVGLALAAAVGQSSLMGGARVLVLEGNTTVPPPTTLTQQYSNRVCALSLGTVKFLKDIEVWSDIESVRVKPFRKIHVWDACSHAAISFVNDDEYGIQFNENSEGLNDDIMGYIVENNVIHRALCNKVENCNIDFKRGITLKAINSDCTDSEKGELLLSLALSKGNDITTKLLVGADGSMSHVRHLGLFKEPLRWNYDQSAVVATLSIQQELTNNDVAWQRFLPSGPIALLPLSDKYSSLVWSTTPIHAKELLQMTSEEFVNAVNRALFEEYPKDQFVSFTDDIISKATSFIDSSSVPVRQYPPTIEGLEENSRDMFPLAFSHSPHYVKSRIALIGDAAHRVHPLAGLGVNLGFNDVSVLYKELLHTSSIGGDWGNLASLLSYEKQSQRLNIPIMTVIDGLQKLFSTSAVPIVALRSLGLQLTAMSKPIKDFIFNQTLR